MTQQCLFSADRPSRGLFVKSPDPEFARILVAAGLDFAVVDLEHSSMSLSQAAEIVSVLCDLHKPVLVRLAETDLHLAGRLLEAGASGLQVSTVTRSRQVDEARAMLDFAPHGMRSVSRAHRVAGYGSLSAAEYVDGTRPLLVCQIETARTVDPLDQLLGSGMDGVFIGLEDLSVSCRGARVNLAGRVDELVEAATRAELPWGLSTDREGAERWVARGAAFVTVGADRSVYADTLRAMAGNGQALSPDGGGGGSSPRSDTGGGS